LADFQWTVYPHCGHPSAEGRAQDRVSSPAKDRRSADCATQPTFSLQCFPNHQVTGGECMPFAAVDADVHIALQTCRRLRQPVSWVSLNKASRHPSNAFHHQTWNASCTG